MCRLIFCCCYTNYFIICLQLCTFFHYLFAVVSCALFYSYNLLLVVVYMFWNSVIPGLAEPIPELTSTQIFRYPLISGTLQVMVLKTRNLENPNYPTRFFRVTRTPTPYHRLRWLSGRLMTPRGSWDVRASLVFIMRGPKHHARNVSEFGSTRCLTELGSPIWWVEKGCSIN